LDKKWRMAYNPFFILPFVVWMIAGGLLLFNFTNKDLFCAINSHHTEFADKLMYLITKMGEGWVIIIVLLLLFAFPRFRNWWYFFAALLCNLLPFFLQQFLKSYYDSPRPINYFKHAAWIHLPSGCPELLYRSYPSGHSAGAFCFFCFISLLLPSRYKPWGLLFFALALAVAYSRIYLAAHFFEDVYAGSIFGTIGCVLVYSIIDQLKVRFFEKKDTFIR
jgi:membrane-associated phospholipid phosphatase